MNLWLISSVLSVTIASLTMLAAFFLNHRSSLDREKLSPFECGFDPKNLARVPFSMRFFLLAIIFIVFDIEIVLLMPIPILGQLNSISVIIFSFLFLLILILGLIHEWLEGSLDWSS